MILTFLICRYVSKEPFKFGEVNKCFYSKLKSHVFFEVIILKELNFYIKLNIDYLRLAKS